MKILQKLLYIPSGSYAKLRLKGVESNHFAYHLDQLVKDGYIVKQDKTYRLSRWGITFVDGLSQERMFQREQPRIVTAIDLTTPDGKTLLFRRNFHPYYKLLDLPMGKIHMEETVAAAAERELKEKTGLAGIKLLHRGIAYVEGRQGKAILAKKLYHVFHAEVERELAVVTPPHRGECFWADHTLIPACEFVPGFLQIKALLASSRDLFFFAEIGEVLPE
jgi:ADP-ribose pyrophosphatase YjhB (NUDIX family)